MKKLFYAFLLIGMFATASNAQFAGKAGINLANISTDEEDVESSSKLGFVIGANYSTAISESLAFRPGLEFSMKGAKQSALGTDAKLKLNYIDIPLDFVYNAGDLSINVGPYLGFLLSAKTSSGDISIDVKDSVSSLDFGLNAGLAYNLGPVSVGAQYGLGLANVNGLDDDDTSVKNNNISFYVMYPF